MKKIIILMMLATGITGKTIGQEVQFVSNTDRIFDMPAGYLKRSFTVDLGKGNKMQLDLSSIDDLERFKNIDSLLRVFLQDIDPLKDSLLDDLASKRIDYHTDEMGRIKIRIQVFRPKGTSFIMQQGNLSSLKLEQDTVNFIGSHHFTVAATLRKPFTEIRYYRLRFIVNNLTDLNSYLSGGLNEKIGIIQKSAKARWIKNDEGQWHIKNGDRSIFSNHQPAGYVSGTGDYLESRIAVNFQNYKNNFVPSFSLGVGLGFNNGRVKNEFGLLWEPNFLFARNTLGNLQTFRNDFLTFTYHSTDLKKDKVDRNISFINDFSFSYLIRRSGNFFEKNTMRIGVGQVAIFKDKIKLTPVLYFNDFFKGVTPGLKLMVDF